jgi:hypothetical protein
MEAYSNIRQVGVEARGPHGLEKCTGILPMISARGRDALAMPKPSLGALHFSGT